MTARDLQALRRAIEIKAALLDRMRATPASAWPRLVRSFLSDLAATGLQDARARFVLLATLVEESRLVANHSPAAAGMRAWIEHFLQAGARPDGVPGCCEQALRRLEEALAAQQEPDGERPRSACTLRIAQLIDQRYMERLTLTSLAASVHEPRGRMAAAFRQEMGTTIHAYLTRVRVEHATDRLVFGEKVEAVMLAVGYHSKRSFYRQFRRLTSVTPGAYRDAAQGVTNTASIPP